MENNPLNHERSVAEKLAMIEAEEAELKRKEEEEKARKERARKAKQDADKAEAKKYEDKIQSILRQYGTTPDWRWRMYASDLICEIYSSPVKQLISQRMRTELANNLTIVENRLFKQQRRKDAIKKFLSIMSIVFVALLSLLAGAFVVYSWLSAENTLLFRIAFGVEIAAAIAAAGVAVVHFVKDNSNVFKVICIVFAIINAAVAVWIGVSGHLVKHDIVSGNDGFMYEIVDGEYYLYGCENNVTELVISTLSENIVGISNDAFKGNTTLTSLTIDVSNLVIENGAFRDCSSLTTVDFIGGDTILNSKVFKNCKKLESVIFDGGSYTFNGSNIFDDCTLLKDIYMNGGSYTGGNAARILGGLKKIAVHHNNANIEVPLKGANELTLVVYPGTDSIFAIVPDILIFADGFDFSDSFYAERGTFDLKPLAPVTYFPQSVTYIPDILGSDRKNYDVYYQGSPDQWESLHIAGDGGWFDVANMNYKEDYIKMHYNSNCRFWETNNVQAGN